MIPASTDEPVVTFTRFARDWFRLLSHGAFADAASRIDELNRHGERWDAEKIQGVLRDYAHSDSVSVADPDTMAGEGRTSLVEFTDGRGYSFEHDVPLGGKWSDLTAQFEFLRRPSGYAVVLHDIHVL
jgi:hypothetical protein